MPTTTNQKVSITQNTDGSFGCLIEVDSTESVQITAADMAAFIQSKDTSVPVPAPTPTPAPAPAA